jgi:hypothetical protein
MLVRRAPSLFFIAHLASSAVFVSFSAFADQDLARARALDQQGVRAYREERYNDAIRFFEESRKVGGPPSEIWNIAKCHVRMDEPEEAVKSIQEYLDQKGLSSADRAEAEQQLHDIEHRHSTLTVASSPAGAAVFLEGHRWAGVTPATIDVPPGEHEVTVELAGHDPIQRTVTAKLGRAVIVDARLSKNASAFGGGASDAHGPRGAGDANDASERSLRARPRGHRILLAAQLGVTVPRFGSIGGSAAPAGYFEAAYVALDDVHAIVTFGARATLTADSWSNTSGRPNTSATCGAEIPSTGGATAFDAFFEGGLAWRPSPRWRFGGDVGLGIATYAMGEAGRDVFVPTCNPAPGVKPAVHFDAIASYALSRELRFLFTPVVLELQPAFDGASAAPRDATGLWLRFGAAAGLAFDIL